MITWRDDTSSRVRHYNIVPTPRSKRRATFYRQRPRCGLINSGVFAYWANGNMLVILRCVENAGLVYFSIKSMCVTQPTADVDQSSLASMSDDALLAHIELRQPAALAAFYRSLCGRGPGDVRANSTRSFQCRKNRRRCFLRTMATTAIDGGGIMSCTTQACFACAYARNRKTSIAAGAIARSRTRHGRVQGRNRVPRRACRRGTVPPMQPTGAGGVGNTAAGCPPGIGDGHLGRMEHRRNCLSVENRSSDHPPTSVSRPDPFSRRFHADRFFGQVGL